METKKAATIFTCFSTGSAISHTISNVFCQALGTAVLVITDMAIGPNNIVSGFGLLMVGLVVFAVGFSLGGTIRYAINPARDLGPRIMHAILPISNGGDSDWSYAWIPVVTPIVGGGGAYIYQAILALI